jgi:rRNA-processing protein FCF1
MKVILDTSFLIDLVRYKIDIKNLDEILAEKYELITISPVIKELEKIASSRKKESKYAKLALKLINLHKIKILTSSEKSADKALTSLSKDAIIATNDTELRKRLKTKRIKTIYLRAKKTLEMS